MFSRTDKIVLKFIFVLKKKKKGILQRSVFKICDGKFCRKVFQKGVHEFPWKLGVG